MDKDIVIKLPNVNLLGHIYLPKESHQLVIFAHGSGSSRLSPRNQFVAHALNQTGIATCLFDLLNEEEEKIDMLTRELRFDIPLLAKRLLAVTEWLIKEIISNRDMNLGYFGSSTGAAAGLLASIGCKKVKAIVSRGGRPDLAGQALENISAATLLIVGENDPEVIELNRTAFNRLPCTKEITIVDKATHLFEEPGALEQVIKLAANWFSTHLK